MTIINSVIKGKQPVIDTLNVTPTTSAQQITAPQGTDGYSPVNVSAVTSSIDANIVAGNIKKDVQILGVTGSYEGTTPTGTKSITANGVYDVTDFASADVQVPTTAPSRYLQYSTDANGKLIHDSAASSLINLNGVTDVGDYMLFKAYEQNQNITGIINLSGLTTISGEYAFGSTFANCQGITGVDLSGLTSASTRAFYYTFYNCGNLTGTVNLNSLTDITGNFAFTYAFSNSGITGFSCNKLKGVNDQAVFNNVCTGCQYLNNVDFSSLKSINNIAFQSAFSGTPALKNITFDNLIAIGTQSGNMSNAFSNSGIEKAYFPHLIFAKQQTFYQTFNGCSSLSDVNLNKLIYCQEQNTFSTTFKNCTSLATLSFPNLAYTTTNLNNAFPNMLQGVTGCTVHFPAEWQTDMSTWSNVQNGFGGTNTTVLFDLPNVRDVDLSFIDVLDFGGLYRTLYNCTAITGLDLSCLTETSGTNSLYAFCEGCSSLTTVNIRSLKTITGSQTLTQMLKGCTSITSVEFPALKTLAAANLLSGMLTGCSNVTVHFPSNLSTTVTAANLGGTNTTVLYDLPACVILTGADTIEYERNPKYDTATALAWRVNGSSVLTATPYYTSGLTDPTVGTTIYSDSACTIAETTVDSIE